MPSIAKNDIFFTKLALERGMRDVINISIKRRDATRSGKGNQRLIFKTAVERPILKQILGGALILFYFSFQPTFLNVFL